jgi:hypothetical protein
VLAPRPYPLRSHAVKIGLDAPFTLDAAMKMNVFFG